MTYAPLEVMISTVLYIRCRQHIEQNDFRFKADLTNTF
jgi:hypothetical protein